MYAAPDRGVVQLVERMHGVHEVVGSSPAAPTNLCCIYSVSMVPWIPFLWCFPEAIATEGILA